MIIEKHKLYERQSLIVTNMTHAVNWSNLTTYTAGVGGGCLACPNGLNWGQILKPRESIYLKNQGKLSDNTTAGVIEVFFGPYHIDKIRRTVTYSATTGLYTFDTNPVHPQLIPASDTTYLVFEPYGAVTADVSGRQICSAVLRNVINTVGTTYTFTLDGAEIITGASRMAVWAPPVSGWTYAAATGWSHTTGDITSLVAGVWVPTIGVTYKVVVTNTTTVAGTGFHFSCGAIDNEVITRSGVSTHYFTAESATALTFDLGAGGTWVGNITSVSVSIHDDGINKMLQNNIAHREVDFYKYSIPAGPVAVSGIILSCGESYAADITHDVCMYYRGTVDQTLVVQQLA
jgi:hypothetical protein